MTNSRPRKATPEKAKPPTFAAPPQGNEGSGAPRPDDATPSLSAQPATASEAGQNRTDQDPREPAGRTESDEGLSGTAPDGSRTPADTSTDLVKAAERPVAPAVESPAPGTPEHAALVADVAAQTPERPVIAAGTYIIYGDGDGGFVLVVDDHVRGSQDSKHISKRMVSVAQAFLSSGDDDGPGFAIPGLSQFAKIFRGK